MAIRFGCPFCQKMLSAPDSAAGKTGKCPRCGARTEIPVRTDRQAERTAAKQGRRQQEADVPGAIPDQLAPRRPVASSELSRRASGRPALKWAVAAIVIAAVVVVAGSTGLVSLKSDEEASGRDIGVGAQVRPAPPEGPKEHVPKVEAVVRERRDTPKREPQWRGIQVRAWNRMDHLKKTT